MKQGKTAIYLTPDTGFVQSRVAVAVRPAVKHRAEEGLPSLWGSARA